MQTAYVILGVTKDASDAEIKQAYLRLVKNNPPERNPQSFQQIHAAYQAIKDHKSRVSYALFTLPAIDFTTVVDKALVVERDLTFDAELFNKLLISSIEFE